MVQCKFSGVAYILASLCRKNLHVPTTQKFEAIGISDAYGFKLLCGWDM